MYVGMAKDSLVSLLYPEILISKSFLFQVNSAYQPIGGKVLGGGQPLVTPVRYCSCE